MPAASAHRMNVSASLAGEDWSCMLRCVSIAACTVAATRRVRRWTRAGFWKEAGALHLPHAEPFKRIVSGMTAVAGTFMRVGGWDCS